MDRKRIILNQIQIVFEVFECVYCDEPTFLCEGEGVTHWIEGNYMRKKLPLMF